MPDPLIGKKISRDDGLRKFLPIAPMPRKFSQSTREPIGEYIPRHVPSFVASSKQFMKKLPNRLAQSRANAEVAKILADQDRRRFLRERSGTGGSQVARDYVLALHRLGEADLDEVLYRMGQ